MKPSWKRRLLVWYIDAWPVHGVIYAVAAMLEIERYSWSIALATLLFLEFALNRMRIPSFGDYALGIKKTQAGDVVDEELRLTAHWLIILLATFEWLGAWRFFGNAVGAYPFYYLAGFRLEGIAAKIVPAVFAVGLAWAALAMFRCKQYAPWGALGVAFLFFVNDLTSRIHTRELLEWYMIRRAVERGRPLAFDAAAGMTIVVFGNIVNLVLIGLLGFFMRTRFRFAGPVWEEWRGRSEMLHYDQS